MLIQAKPTTMNISKINSKMYCLNIFHAINNNQSQPIKKIW
ncbi:hypothetical protein HMPREF3208_01352 [Gardnerella vaginalis]|uniref:Uncharacterized protein n=1 Tax=Gardnerella vaginalis TaxID=2702 RepID=A0A133NR35_GARVA|nr:hypothetical protein HMPREF3208_01352 [Gardnerella vaginalis]